MKKYATTLLLAASLGFAGPAFADDDKEERPAPGGKADAEEGERRRPAPEGPGAERPRPFAPGGPGAPGGEGPGQRPNFLEAMRGADTDGDKKISLEEWKISSAKRAEEMFKRLDGDADGYLSAADLEKMRERAGGPGEGRPGGPGAERPGGPGKPEGDRPPRPGGDEGAGGPKRPARPEAE